DGHRGTETQREEDEGRDRRPLKLRDSIHILFALVISFGSAACNQTKSAEQAKPTGPAAAVQTTTYHSRGVVKATNERRPSIELDHENIEGLMPAMTMEFYVKDKALLEGLRPGDRVEFTIENGVGGLTITQIKKLS